MEKQSSNQVQIKEASYVIVTNRNLLLQSEELTYYLKGYEQWLRVLGYTKSTVYYFPAYLRSFFYFLEKHGIQRLAKLKSAHIRQYLSSLSRQPNIKTGNPLSKNYLLNHLNAIKRFSRYLSDCHNFILDSSAKVTIGTPVKRKCLTIEEVKKLYESCDNTPGGITNRAILSIYYGLGLRRSEGTGLDIADILSSEGVVYVRKGKFSKERYVPMTEAICSDLQKYITEVRSMLVITFHLTEEKALLLSEKGERFTGNAIYNRLQHMAKDSGIQTPLPLHSLRHSIATHLLQSGMSLENIGSFLGHNSLESTQIYTHLLYTDK